MSWPSSCCCPVGIKSSQCGVLGEGRAGVVTWSRMFEALVPAGVEMKVENQRHRQNIGQGEEEATSRCP